MVTIDMPREGFRVLPANPVLLPLGAACWSRVRESNPLKLLCRQVPKPVGQLDNVSPLPESNRLTAVSRQARPGQDVGIGNPSRSCTEISCLRGRRPKLLVERVVELLQGLKVAAFILASCSGNSVTLTQSPKETGAATRIRTASISLEG